MIASIQWWQARCLRYLPCLLWWHNLAFRMIFLFMQHYVRASNLNKQQFKWRSVKDQASRSGLLQSFALQSLQSRVKNHNNTTTTSKNDLDGSKCTEETKSRKSGLTLHSTSYSDDPAGVCWTIYRICAIIPKPYAHLTRNLILIGPNSSVRSRFKRSEAIWSCHERTLFQLSMLPPWWRF